MLTLFVGSVLSQNALKINLKDGNTFTIGLSENPSVAYSDTSFVLKSASVELQFAYSKVENIIFIETDLTEIPSVGSASQLSLNDGTIYITGAAVEEDVLLITIDGKNIAKYKTDKEGSVTFSVSEYPSGMYIIKMSNLTFKIIKK